MYAKVMAWPIHRDKTAMNGAQSGLCDFVSMRIEAMPGPPAYDTNGKLIEVNGDKHIPTAGDSK